MIEFELVNDNTLRLANFRAPTSRAEFYEDISSAWSESSANLASSVEDCVPLAWELQSIYAEYREALQQQIDDFEDDVDSKKLTALQAELDSLPEEPEYGVVNWLLELEDDYFADVIVGRVTQWLSSEPDWAFEGDYISDTGTAEGIAYSYFRSMDFEQLAILGVEIVEGEHPGSTYYAAELRCSIDQANKAASSHGIPVSFVRRAC
jgi:hypothetical protein